MRGISEPAGDTLPYSQERSSAHLPSASEDAGDNPGNQFARKGLTSRRLRILPNSASRLIRQASSA